MPSYRFVSFRAAALALSAAFPILLHAQTFHWNPDSVLLNGGGELNKAYNWTENANGTGAWPKSALDDDFTSASLTGWSWIDATGGADAARSVTGGQLSIKGRGGDVWFGTNQFASLHKTFPDTFDISIKVVSQTKADPWSKAGIMVMNTMSNPSSGGCFAVIVTPDNGIKVQFDSLTTQAGFDYPEGPGVTGVAFPVWLRVARKGGAFYGYYRTGLSSPWVLLRRGVPLTTAATVQAGPFVTSHDVDTASTVVFDDFQSGGPLSSAALDLAFDGTSTTADSNARLGGPMAARSLSLAGFDGTFAFGGTTLTLSGNADFGTTATVLPGTLTFGNGNQTLKPKPGTLLPSLVKQGGGTLTLASSPVLGGILTVTGSTVDLGGRGHAFSGLAGTSAVLTGLTAADTLVVAGNADFSGFTSLPAAGTIQVRCDGDASPQRDAAFNPGPAAFNHLVLWPVPAAFPARIAVGAGNLIVNGNLTLRDDKGAAGRSGMVDLRGGNATVTVGGTLAASASGSGESSLRLRMGDGRWTAKGNVAFSSLAGLDADNSTFDLSAAGPQSLAAGSATLGAVVHSGAGTLTLQGGAPLKAASFAQTAGALALNGSDIDVGGKLSVTGGSLQGLGGRALKAGGDIALSGTAVSALALAPASAWSASAGGALTSDFAEIGNGTATGSEGQASANTVDKGSNTRWKFTAPAMVRAPNSPAVLTGTKAVFTVKASGSGPMAYAWRKRGDTAVLSTDTLLEVTAAPALHGAKYFCAIANTAGTLESSDGVLTVNEPAGVDAQPQDTTVVLGQPASFTAVAKGTGPFKYRWRKTGDTATVDTNAVFAIAKTAAAQDGAGWACTISNAYGSAVTRTALLRILHPAKITRQPADADVVEGKAVRFSVGASGTGALAFAWFRLGEPDTLAKDSVLDVTAALADSGRKFFCTVRNAYGQESSISATLTVGRKPGIAAQPADTTVFAGLPATFKVRATGTGPLAFAWRKVGKPDTLGRDSTLVIPPVAWADSGARYVCRVSNKYGDTLTREAELKVVRPPAITREPGDLVIVAGQPARFSVGITGSSPLDYAWTRKGDTAVLSRDTAYSIGSASLADSNSFYLCRVTNPYGAVSTREARLTVVQAATIVREPSNASAPPGKPAVFTVGAVGAKPMAYAWRRKGQTAVLSADSSLKIDTVKLKDDGALFTVIVSNAFGADTSREVRLSVVTCDSVFQVSPETLSVEEGQPAVLKGTAACALARQWSWVSGPAPRILDPEVDTLAFTAPRIGGADTVTVFRFSAEYATGWVHKQIAVRIREAIPDPKFTLPPAAKWNGQKPYAVRPTVTNLAALKAAPYAPPFRYQWYLSPLAADTAQAGDSLTLSEPTAEGNLDVTLCLDNGGSISCVIHPVTVAYASTRLADRAARLGPVSLRGSLLEWNADAVVRVWAFDGRILWRGRGRAGAATILPEGAARDLFRGRARLEIVK